MTTFEQFCKDVRRLLLFYGVGGGQVLSNLELNYCWRRGLSIYTTYDISTDVANGFSFDEAVAAATGHEMLHVN